MPNVVPISTSKGSRKVVHAMRTEHLTWCGWNIRSDRTIGGRPVMLAYSTTEQVSCSRCTARMKTSIFTAIKKMSPREIDKVAALLGVRQ